MMTDEAKGYEYNEMKTDLTKFAHAEIAKGKSEEEVLGGIRQTLVRHVDENLERAIVEGDIDVKAVGQGVALLLMRTFKYEIAGVEAADLDEHYKKRAAEITAKELDELVNNMWLTRPNMMQKLLTLEEPGMTQIEHYVQVALIGFVIQARNKFGPSPADNNNEPLSCMRELVVKSASTKKFAALLAKAPAITAKDTRELRGTRTHERKRLRAEPKPVASSGAGAGSGAASDSRSSNTEEEEKE